MSLQRWRGISIGGLIIVAVLYVFHPLLLTGVAAFMTIHDQLEPADIILPLYHEGDTVPFAAADLYRRHYADRVVLIRARPSRLQALGLVPPPDEVWRRVLEAEGVPAEAIITITPLGEDEEAMALDLDAVMKGHKMIRIIVVASAPLTRLSRGDLRHRLEDSRVELRMYPVRPREFDEQTWWRYRHGWITYFDVYYLWLLRFLRD